MSGGRLRGSVVGLLVFVAIWFLPRAALAQVLRDRAELSVDMAMAGDASCITVPESMRDPELCANAVNVPTAGFATNGSILVGVAQRRVDEAVVLAVVSRIPAGPQPKVGDRAVTSFLGGLEGALARNKAASKVQHTPVDVLSDGTPHFTTSFTVTGSKGAVETRSHMFYGVDAVYTVSYVAAPRHRAAVDAWEHEMMRTVHVARPSHYVPDYVEPPSASYQLGESLGRLMVYGMFVIALVVIGVNARKKKAAQPPPPPSASPWTREPPEERKDWWDRK